MVDEKKRNRRAHYIPHVLIKCVQKEMEVFLANQKEEPETISEYIKKSTNPRWAASHLVRAIADGLFVWESPLTDRAIAVRLYQIANELSQTNRGRK